MVGDVELLPDVELPVASINTPPTIAGGEMLVVFTAATLYAARVAPVDLGNFE